MIVTVPDEICERFLGEARTPNAVQNAIVKQLHKALELGLNGNCLVLKPEQVQFLQDMLGAFTDAADLVDRIRRVGTLKVQGKEYLLNAGQIARLKQEAFFHRNPGEPRDEASCKSPEQAERIISRYTIRQIDYFMKQMCSQL